MTGNTKTNDRSVDLYGSIAKDVRAVLSNNRQNANKVQHMAFCVLTLIADGAVTIKDDRSDEQTTVTSASLASSKEVFTAASRAVIAEALKSFAPKDNAKAEDKENQKQQYSLARRALTEAMTLVRALLVTGHSLKDYNEVTGLWQVTAGKLVKPEDAKSGFVLAGKFRPLDGKVARAYKTDSNGAPIDDKNIVCSVVNFVRIALPNNRAAHQNGSVKMSELVEAGQKSDKAMISAFHKLCNDPNWVDTMLASDDNMDAVKTIIARLHAGISRAEEVAKADTKRSAA